jgi:hypothetical protein
VEDSIRWSVSSLIIAFRHFCSISDTSAANLVRNPSSGFHYPSLVDHLTLFIAAGFIIGDLITLVYNLRRRA